MVYSLDQQSAPTAEELNLEPATQLIGVQITNWEAKKLTFTDKSFIWKLGHQMSINISLPSLASKQKQC